MASTTVRELITIWGFDIDDEPLKNLDKGLQNIKDSVKVVGALAVGAGAALFGMAELTSRAGNEIKVSADKMGLGTAELQEYRFAAEQAGVSTQALDGLFVNFNKTIGEARQGFGSGRTGIELMARETGVLIDLTGTQAEQFDQVVDGLTKIEDQAKRAAVAEQFFGSQGRELATFLDQGSGKIAEFRQEFRDLGGVMGEDLIEDSRKFQQAQSDILAIITGVRNEIAGELLPVMVEVADGVKTWFKENREIIKQNIGKTIQFIVKVFKLMLPILSKTSDFIFRITGLFGGMEKSALLVLKVLSAIMSLKLAAGFGSLVLSGFQFIAMLKSMGTAAIIAQAKLLAIPLAIAAIIAVIALIAEDIVSFAQGRDSVFGRMVEGLETVFGGLEEKFGIFGKIGKQIIITLLTPLRAIINLVKSIITVFDVLRGKASFLEGISTIGKNIANTFGFGVKSAAGAVGFAEKGPPTGEQISAATTLPPGAGVLARPGGDTNNNVRGQFDINVTGLPPEQAKEAATDAFENLFGTMTRETQRDTAPEREI